jgi:hypothetical protein
MTCDTCDMHAENFRVDYCEACGCYYCPCRPRCTAVV